jgi:uncharacterized protein (DUF58 family)
MIPTTRTAMLLAALGLCLFAWSGESWWALAAVNLVVIAMVIGDAVLCAAPSTMEVTREVPDSVRVGDTIEIAWVIGNRGARPAHVTVTDALWPSFQATRRSVPMLIAPGTQNRATAELSPSRRGRFPLDHVTVRVTGPLGLVARQATRSVPGSLKVMPAYPSRDSVRRRLRTPRIPDVGVRSVRSAGGGTEFDQLREYRDGDEFRRIDWASTTRMQRTIVRQFRTEMNQTVVLLLDNGRVMAGTVDGVPRVEHAMDAALAVADATAFMGDRIGMVAFDRQVRAIVPATSGRRHLGRVSEAMYLLEPDLAESAYTAAFSAAAARFRRRSLYVVLTDLAEATVEQTVRPALAILVRRHVVVVASVRDPAVMRWATGGDREWPSDAFRQASAVAAIDSRDRAAARLRSAGAIVIDAEPGTLAVRLVDTYLELKAAGRL